MSVAGVEIERVSFGYGKTQILDDVSLRVEKGEFFAFLGPSGSGKTTLLRLVAGFGTPSQGAVRVNGRDVTDTPPWKRNVGMVFQSYALWPHMTVAKNVAFGLERRDVPKAEIARRVGEALALVGLADYGGRRPAQLSGGQQQRVAVARTLVIEPEVLLLDEPLSNLDAKLRVEMRQEIRELQRKLGLTTIYVTHDQEEANAIADRIAVLDGGRIQQLGAPMALYDRPANRFVATFLGTANLIEGELRADGRFQAPGFALEGVTATRAGAACVSFRPHDVKLVPADGAAASGMVRHREFLGGTIRYVVAVGAHNVTVDTVHRRDASAHDIGARVGLAIDARQASVLF
jgi:iron(III) transport system ATP-binding protein